MDWIDTANTESKELEPVWMERAKEILGEDLEERPELISELKKLVRMEKNLKVPESEHFFLMFLRSGLMNPTAGLGVMKNYFLLKKNHPQYFEASRAGPLYLVNYAPHGRDQHRWRGWSGLSSLRRYTACYLTGKVRKTQISFN